MKNKALVVVLGFLALGIVSSARAASDVTGPRMNIGAVNSLGAGADWAGVIGVYNTNNSPESTIAGGELNIILTGGDFGGNFIGSGYGNYIAADVDDSSVVGGSANRILDDSYVSVICGGTGSVISNASPYSIIGGGSLNFVGSNSAYGSILSGEGSTIHDSAGYSTIAGGAGNEIFANLPPSNPTTFATIGGGNGNKIMTNCVNSTIAGGAANTIKNDCGGSAIGGGSGHIIGTNSPASTIAGGDGNTVGANASYATVGGGGNSWATGLGATVPGGYGNAAEGSYSLAAGLYAVAAHDGCFIWGDSAPHNVSTSSSNQFVVRAAGGFWFGNSSGTISIPSGHFIETTAHGAYLGTDGVWYNPSDRDIKKNFTAVEATEVLRRLIELPVSSWNYKSEDSVRHMGPMAQDFYAAFGLGQDDRHISTLDGTGVAFAAIQGLHQIVKENESEINVLRGEVAELRKKTLAQQETMAKWENRLAALEKAADDAALTAQSGVSETAFAQSDR